MDMSHVRVGYTTSAREAGVNSDHRKQRMRTFILAVAVLGVLVAGFGIFLTAR
jgi:hypothetical protein